MADMLTRHPRVDVPSMPKLPASVTMARSRRSRSKHVSSPAYTLQSQGITNASVYQGLGNERVRPRLVVGSGPVKCTERLGGLIKHNC
jgi:hypothetical protein